LKFYENLSMSSAVDTHMERVKIKGGGEVILIFFCPFNLNSTSDTPLKNSAQLLSNNGN
jgi:hypothetical protein